MVPITAAMIDHAATIAGITVGDDVKAAMIDGLNSQRDDIAEIRKLKLPNSVSPAFNFDPVPGGMVLDTAQRPMVLSKAPSIEFNAGAGEAANTEKLAFATVRELAELIRTKRITSMTLTRMYLARLKRLDEKLHCVITLTEERALKKAATADAEIAAGRYRGPLHGIPWGAKDLLAVRGYKTTLGAGPYKDQTIDHGATVVQRLDAAGAILVAKLTFG